MHFINKIINKQIDESVHRRFIKFSKGTFMNGGPIILAKLEKNKAFSLNASFEYEDLVGEFISNILPDGQYGVQGIIYTQPHVVLSLCEEIIKSLSLQVNWEKGKRELKNLYSFILNESKGNSEIKEIYPKLSDTCFILLNINPSSGKAWKLTTKDKIPSIKKMQDSPQPSCKPEKQEKCNYLQFCEKYGICINERINFIKVKTGSLDENTINNFIEAFLPDFKEKIPEKFSEIILANQYIIEGLIDPPNKDGLSPKELREKIIKKGYINRILLIDKQELINKVDFEV